MKMDTLWWLILEVKNVTLGTSTNYYLTLSCFILLEKKQLSGKKLKSLGFKVLFGSLQILLMSINSFSAVIIKAKVGQTKC